MSRISETRPTPERWERALPLLLLAWRLITQPPAGLWRDWVVIVAAFWLYTTFRFRSPSWPTVTVSVMAYLFGIYALGQMPHTLVALGLRP